MTKVTIIYGTTSSGKTTLAREIADETGADLLDEFHIQHERDVILVIPAEYEVEVIETVVNNG